MYRQISLLFVVSVTLVCNSCGNLYLDNFQKHGDVSLWKEHSDPIVDGKSKANFAILKTQVFRRAVLFTMLNPDSCGAGFAGIMKNVSVDASNYTRISMRIRGQGQYRGYEFILRHRGITGIHVPAYVHYFKAPMEFGVIHLQLSNFKLYLKGEPLEEKEPLDRSELTTVGLLAYGGRYLLRKQSGVAALEIDWIRFD